MSRPFGDGLSLRPGHCPGMLDTTRGDKEDLMTTQTTQTSQVTYRKTQSGEWVAYGPAHILEGAMQHNLPVTVTKRDGNTDKWVVTRIGKKFLVDGQYMAYGYGHRQGDTPTVRRTNTCPQRARRCATGGNCSSFGDGRSCGGYDCDGW